MNKKGKENSDSTHTEVAAFLAMEEPTSPRYVEQSGAEYVPYGDALIPQYGDRLLELFHNCATHNSIIRTIASQVAGAGLEAEDGTDIKEILEALTIDGEDMNDVLLGLGEDIAISGGAYLFATVSNDWANVRLQHVGFNKVRVAPVDDEGKIPGVFYKYDWTHSSVAPKYIPMYNSKANKLNAEKYKQYEKELIGAEGKDIVGMPEGSKLQCIMIRQRSESPYYPKPSYTGAINAIEADIEADVYGKNSMKNGMDVGLIFDFKTAANRAVRDKLVTDTNAAYTGAKNAGKPMYMFTAPNGVSPTITKLTATDVDKRYTVITETAQQKILTAHRITNPALAGIQTAGKLGGVNELPVAQELFDNTVIKPIQYIILRVLNRILKGSGVPELVIKSSTPIGFTFSEAVLSKILTIDEMRAKIGYAPMGEAEKIAIAKTEEENELINKPE